MPEIRDREERLPAKRSRVLRRQAMLTYVLLITALLIIFIFTIHDGKFFSFRLGGHSTKGDALSIMMVMAAMLGGYFSLLTTFLQRLRRYLC